MPRLVVTSIAALTLGLFVGLILAFTFGGAEADPRPPVALADSRPPAVLTGPRPDPRWSPAEVVAFQMDSLRRASADPAAFEDCYRFASPLNREIVGSLERFQKMLEVQYAAMVGHREAAVGREYVLGSVASVLTTGVGSSGEFMCYQFTLSRQEGGEFDGCWMTDSVFEVRPNLDGTPAQDLPEPALPPPTRGVVG